MAKCLENIEEIKEKWKGTGFRNSGRKIYIDSINPLPHGYIFSFSYENGFPYCSFCVNVDEEVDVIPKSAFSSRFKEFLASYLLSKNLLLEQKT